MKRIVVCCDGTWNAPENPTKQEATNVLETSRAVLPEFEGIHQIVEYISGIGTYSGFVERQIRGATGWGISENIEHAYTFIVNNYVYGDHIYLFGFSRGAYTVRSLAGFIHAQGLIKKSEMHNFYLAYEEYRKPPERRDRRYGEKLRDITERPAEIYFIGVWDTVGSLSAPFGSKDRVSFHDTTLPANVGHAYHALAIHELREDFKPDLWTNKNQPQVMQQVWFPGSHSDVGGGLGLNNRDLSDIAWRWMLEKSEAIGLGIDWNYVGSRGAQNGKKKPIHFSRTSRWIVRDTWRYVKSAIRFELYDGYVRPIGANHVGKFKTISLCEFRHSSVLERLNNTNSSQRGYKEKGSLHEADLRSKSLPLAP